MPKDQQRNSPLTDEVHRLIAGENAEIRCGGEKADTMRLVLDVPKAWVLLAAWLHTSGHDRETGEPRSDHVHQWPYGDDAEKWDHLRKLARRYFAGEIHYSMHDHLHYLCTGGHYDLHSLPKEPSQEAQRLCCTAWLPGGLPLSPDGLILRVS